MAKTPRARGGPALPVGESWRPLERLLADVERPARYIDTEWGAIHEPDAEYRVCLVYPDTYEIGMANQGLAILYSRLNSQQGVAAERAFVPWKDMAEEIRRAGVELPTLESQLPVRECQLVGITLPYELTYTNILEFLDLAGIPLRAAERTEGEPLVIGGGPCAYNPEPIAAFFDAFLLGDGEGAVEEIAATHSKILSAGGSRNEALKALALIQGVYVPSFYRESFGPGGDFRGLEVTAPAPELVCKRALPRLGAGETPLCPIVPYMDVVHDRAAVEIARGCARGCRFCQAGIVYRPVRERPADSVVQDALTQLECTGHDEVSLTSLSVADHSRLPDILRRLRRRLQGTDVSVSLPSLRVDSFSVDLARMITVGKRPGLTFAPEAGNDRLRRIINKNVTDEQLLVTVRHAFQSGWRRIKLYFMIGLPAETDDDVTAIGELVARVLDEAREASPSEERNKVRIAVSVTTFVPKAHTPFQWEAQVTREEALRRQAILRAAVPRRGVELSWHDADTSFLEGVLARGGRDLAGAIEAAWRSGARFDAWTDEFDLARWESAFALAGIDAEAVTCRSLAKSEVLPWSHLSSGVDDAFLWAERERAYAGEATTDCTTGSCSDCGVCGTLGVENVVEGERSGW